LRHHRRTFENVSAVTDVCLHIEESVVFFFGIEELYVTVIRVFGHVVQPTAGI